MCSLIAKPSCDKPIDCPHADIVQKSISDPTLIDSLWKEHKSLEASIHQRGTGYLLTNSILITGSLVLLSGILTASGGSEGLRFVGNLVIIPLLIGLEYLIFVAWYWFESVKKVDQMAHRRVNEIEVYLRKCGLPVEGGLSLYEELKNKWWYQIRASVVWRGLFLILFIMNALVLLSLFSQRM